MTNKRFAGIVVTMFLIFAAVFVSAGCDDKDSSSPAPTPNGTFTVTFDSNGGSAVASVRVSSGGTIAAPDNPTREGYVFAGWFKDREFTQSFAFGENGDKVTANITLYARWITLDEIQADYAVNEIVIGYAEGDNPNYVTQNLTLPAKIGSAYISWSSSSAAVSTSGNVTRQADDTNVTLTARASYNGKTSEPRSFTVKVIRRRTRSNSTIKPLTIDRASSGDISVERNESGDVTEIEGQYVSFDIRNADDALDAVTVLRDELGIRSPDRELKTFLAASGRYGAEYSFRQMYKGVEVYGRSLTASVNLSGKGDFLHSSILASNVLDGAGMKVNLTAAQAEAFAVSAYSGEIEVDTEHTELIVYSLEDYANNPVYAYVVRVYGTSEGEYVDDDVFVNAETGQVIQKFMNMFNTRAKTVWQYGEDETEHFYVVFPTTEYHENGRTYLLMFDTAGLNPPILVFSGDMNGSAVRIISGDQWNDGHQNSAYSNMREIMQWWKASFDRNSLDNKGMIVRVVTHERIIRDRHNNASWMPKGEYMCIDDVDSESEFEHSQAVNIDVLAHESTHAVICYIAGYLPNNNATGATHEGYADIFGCLKEHDWRICWRTANDPANPEIGITSYRDKTRCLRDARENVTVSSLSNGKYSTIDELYHMYRTIDPKNPNYKDGNGVHTYCQLVTHAAYLMHKDNNSLNGLTWDELGQVWYESLYMGLDAASSFDDIRRCVIWAAMKIDLSAEKIAVIKAAFDEVGITEAKFKGTVYGIVKDKTDLDKVLEGVSVTASEKKLRNGRIKSVAAGRTTTTSAGGYFIQLEAGKYILSFDKAGYVSESIDTQIVSHEGVEVNMRMNPVEVSLSGTVRNASDDSRISGAAVNIRKGWGNYASEILKSTTTDANGLYYFDLMREGSGFYTVDVSKQGYKSASLEVAVGGKTAGRDLALMPISNDISVSDEIPVDEEHFSDENFREYVKTLDTNNSRTLSTQEIALVERIDVSNKNISSLKGIEYFSALKYLDCSYNRLTEIDISNNILLEQLLCSNNQLTEINLTANTALKRLSCINNMLKGLDVSRNINLVTLGCGSESASGYDTQEITVLDLSKNTSLRSLTCRKAGLTSLILGKNSALEYVDCQYNDIKVLDISGCPNLNSSNVLYDPWIRVISSSLTVSYQEVLASLQVFIPESTGIYIFNVSLDHEIPEGSSLLLISDSEDLNGVFTDTDFPMSVNVSAEFTAGRCYSPIIAARHESETQSSGCNIGALGIMVLLAGMSLMKKSKTLSK